MTRSGSEPATVAFAGRVTDRSPPSVETEIVIAAPPALPRPARGAALTRMLPLVIAVALAGLTAAVYRSGTVPGRSPVFLLFPLMMLISATATAVLGRQHGRGADLEADREDYLEYLAGLRATVTGTAAAQRDWLAHSHPQPTALWTLCGGPQMWERRTNDSDFGRVRVGTGAVRLATALVAPELDGRADPVTDTALRRFMNTHTSIPNAPVTVDLFGSGVVRADGGPDDVRALLRAIICQLAVLHRPDELRIAAVIADGNRKHWDWLKWLPHHQHPCEEDQLGALRMTYPTLGDAAQAIVGRPSSHVVLVVDNDAEETLVTAADVAVLLVGSERCQRAPAAGIQLRVNAAALAVHLPHRTEVFARPDRLSDIDALVCARRLAGYRAAASGTGELHRIPHWAQLLGIGDINRLDPQTRWDNTPHQDRLAVPIGTDADGRPVWLDIKEAADNGMGPHGLCVGATGSGKSELLRTVVLGMIARHSPEDLNLVLVDFKGGATFLGFEKAAHVAAIVTNLADEAELVARMRDALAGELHRRQELLRAAGNFSSAADYRAARRAGASLAPLPALFVIVDEFAELLSQHPDFIDTFVAIGRLGRSLGIHLLLASQRLDEGRLRGLESHLSYRICLKTLSANESRLVLGVPDAHELPSAPGRGFLKSAAGELTGFRAAFVSGPNPTTPQRRPRPAVQPFTTTAVPVAAGAKPAQSGRSVLQTVLAGLAGHGPSAHQVWLPPLGVSPPVGELIAAAPCGPQLVVPIGLVDRPFEQRQSLFTVDLRGGAGNVAVVGAPQTGKSTALATLITALSGTHDPDRVRFYGLDFGGGTLASLRGLPHVGSVTGREDPDLVRATVREMEAIAARREALFREHGVGSVDRYRQLPGRPACPDVFLVVDGWASLCGEFDALESPITALAGRGLSYGVHVVLSAARWADIRPPLRDQIGTRVELRLGDPADSELDRAQARGVPRDKPGRALTDTGLHALIALPQLDGAARDWPAAMAAPPIPVLPDLVHRRDLLDSTEPTTRYPLLGIGEHGLRAVPVDFQRQPHLVILGDNECGKTSVLRTLCRELTRTCPPGEAQLLLVDYRRGLLGQVEPNQLLGHAMSAATLSTQLPVLLDRLAQRMPGTQVTQQQLRDRSWWSGPQLYVLVDDYDLVVTAAGNPLAPLIEYLPHAADLGLHLVVARRSGGAARALYEPMLAALRDLGCMGLLMSASPEEGPLIGSIRPAPQPPGRGILITRSGGEQLVQVAWSPT